VSVVAGTAVPGGGVPLGAVRALSWCGEVSVGDKHIIATSSSLAAVLVRLARCKDSETDAAAYGGDEL